MTADALRSSGLRLLAILAITSATTTTLAAQQQTTALTNADLIRMTQAGIEEATIVKLVESSPVAFDTSASAIIALKNAGVGDRVIHAAVAAGNASLQAQSAGLYPRPEEIGVYVNLREQLVPLKVEVVTWRGGGVAKQMLLGTRGHVNASVFKPMSPVRLESRPEFIVHCAEGTVAEEYQLLRLWGKKDRREFRIVTGGVFHASSGAGMNAVEMTIERVGVRLYRLTPALPLSPGEYRVPASRRVALRERRVGREVIHLRDPGTTMMRALSSSVLLVCGILTGQVIAAPVQPDPGAMTGTVYFFFNGVDLPAGMWLKVPSVSILVDGKVVAKLRQRQSWASGSLPAVVRSPPRRSARSRRTRRSSST